MKLLILCGGRGTRLASITNGRQKCSLEINGKPFIIHIIQNIEKYFPITSICLCIGHSANDIISIDYDQYLSSNTIVEFSMERESLGTGGAIKNAIGENTFDEELIICNGDSICDVANLREGYLRSSGIESAGIIASAFTSQAQRYGTLIVDKRSKILTFSEKNSNSSEGIINAGVYILKSEILFPLLISQNKEKFSLEKDIFPSLVNKFELYISQPTKNFIDIGIPEDFVRTSSFLNSYL